MGLVRLAEKDLGSSEDIRVDWFYLIGYVFQREGHYIGPSERGHRSEVASQNHIHGMYAASRSQDPVVGAGSSAPLDVSEHSDPRAQLRARLYLAPDDLADAAQMVFPVHA